MSNYVDIIQWSVSKEDDWYDSYFNPIPMDCLPKSIYSDYPNQKILFSAKFSLFDFIKYFRKYQIKFDLLPNSKDKTKYAIIDPKDVEFLFTNNVHYEFCFITVPENMNPKLFENLDFDYRIEKIKNEDLDKIQSTLLYWYNDGYQAILTSKNYNIIKEHLIKLFHLIISDQPEKIKSLFTDELLLNLMNLGEGSYEISRKSINVIDNTSVSFELWNSTHLLPTAKVTTVTVTKDGYTFSDWIEMPHKNSPSSKNNRFGCYIFLSIITLIVILVYLVIKYVF